jgi:peptide/nickel transport system permease protein
MHPLLKRILWRLLAGLFVIWGAATLSFVAVHATAGDAAVAILGGDEAWASAEVLESVRRTYGLDQPLHVQYGRYLARLASGDLGESYRLRIPVLTAIGQQIGATFLLTAVASVIAVVLASVVALATARRRPWVRSTVSGAELVLSSMPSFVVGILLLLLFAFQFRLFPASGSRGWQSLVLPALSISLPLAAILSQVLRQELEEILEQPFILTARTRGLGEVGVRLGHAWRHSLVTLATMSGFVVGGLLGGAVIAESLFARQGLGRLLLEAANHKDVPLVLGVTLLAALVYVVVNLVVDLLYPLIDPRIKTL